MPPYIFKLIELVRKSVLCSPPPPPPLNIEALMVLPNLKVAPRSMGKQGKSKRLRDVSLFSGGGGALFWGEGS